MVTTSTAQSVTLTNTGKDTLNIFSVTGTRDFAQAHGLGIRGFNPAGGTSPPTSEGPVPDDELTREDRQPE